jgi:hypothetical protein
MNTADSDEGLAQIFQLHLSDINPNSSPLSTGPIGTDGDHKGHETRVIEQGEEQSSSPSGGLSRLPEFRQNTSNHRYPSIITASADLTLQKNRELISQEIQANEQQLVKVQERITHTNHEGYKNLAKITDGNQCRNKVVNS